MVKRQQKKIILICSDGGHLAQILELNEWFTGYNYLLVTEKTPATMPLCKSYNIRYLIGRSAGKKRNFLFYIKIVLNFFITIKILLSHYPRAIITTGSHTAVPMFILGKLLRIKLIWILSYARINSRAFSANLIYPLADKFLVQWPNAQKLYKRSIFLGSIY
jgi:beta-1,4-N-acetylglucosaminyltransferase